MRQRGWGRALSRLSTGHMMEVVYSRALYSAPERAELASAAGGDTGSLKPQGLTDQHHPIRKEGRLKVNATTIR